MMFPTRLSELTAADIQVLIISGVAEGTDIEFKQELPSKTPPDLWMSGGRIGDEAKDQLAEEIIAFANTDGGTLFLGIGEDRSTKQAVGPVRPLPKCKEAANTLFQSIVSRVEPRLPLFECVGVITEQDGTSGVVVMRTLPSYLAPHRHSSSRHCFVRRDDATVPMSMVEIQEMAKRTARTMEDIDRAFSESADRFYKWIPSKHWLTSPDGGERHLQAAWVLGVGQWTVSWGLRITAKPMGQSISGNTRQWLDALDDFGGRSPKFQGHDGGRPVILQKSDLIATRAWNPRLRAFERVLEGHAFTGVDRIGADGQIDRTIFMAMTQTQSPTNIPFSVNEFLWCIASVFCFVDVIRFQAWRPSQSFALDIELLMSNPLKLLSHLGIPAGSNILPPFRVGFPRYEIGPREEFDELLATIGTDLWNSAGHQPEGNLVVDWPDTNV
jgi:hypothetical protein